MSPSTSAPTAACPGDVFAESTACTFKLADWVNQSSCPYDEKAEVKAANNGCRYGKPGSGLRNKCDSCPRGACCPNPGTAWAKPGFYAGPNLDAPGPNVDDWRDVLSCETDARCLGTGGTDEDPTNNCVSIEENDER